MPVPHPWSEIPQGWSAFVSDLQLGTDQEVRTPKGNKIDLRDNLTWVANQDDEGDILSWTRTLPTGKQVIIFND